MFSLFDRPAGEHFIDDGHLWCPVRGHDVEFDLCAGCRALEAIELEAERPYVRCAPEAPRAWLLRRLV
jgi:hypothetical protein